MSLPERPDSDQPPARIGYPYPDPRRAAELLGIDPPHRWAELTTGGPLQRPAQGTTLYLRKATECVQLSVAAGVLSAEYHGYSFDAFGRLVNSAPAAPAWPCWRSGLVNGTEIYLQVWRWRLAHSGAPFSAELFWDPQSGIRKSIQVHHDPPRWEDRYFRDAGRAMRLLHALQAGARRGRPGEPREMARQRILDAGRRACKRYDIDPEKLTRPMVAQELNRSGPPGQSPRADDVWTRADMRLSDLKRALDDEQTEFS
jgi:hypothetical protein